MVYYNDKELMIRNMEEADARIFTDEENAQGWHTDISKYLERLRDQAAGKCVSLTAVYKGLPVGYVNVYLTGLVGIIVYCLQQLFTRRLLDQRSCKIHICRRSG